MIRFVADQAGSGRILILVNGKLADCMSYDTARKVAQALTAVSKVAENNANPNKTIGDQAVLMRAGSPICLNVNPKMIDEARKESVYNRDLRRYMKSKHVDSLEYIHTPVIKGGAKK